jgi:hypothetical protein
MLDKQKMETIRQICHAMQVGQPAAVSTAVQPPVSIEKAEQSLFPAWSETKQVQKGKFTGIRDAAMLFNFKFEQGHSVMQPLFNQLKELRTELKNRPDDTELLQAIKKTEYKLRREAYKLRHHYIMMATSGDQPLHGRQRWTLPQFMAKKKYTIDADNRKIQVGIKWKLFKDDTLSFDPAEEKKTGETNGTLSLVYLFTLKRPSEVQFHFFAKGADPSEEYAQNWNANTRMQSKRREESAGCATVKVPNLTTQWKWLEKNARCVFRTPRFTGVKKRKRHGKHETPAVKKHCAAPAASDRRGVATGSQDPATATQSMTKVKLEGVTQGVLQCT